MDPTGLDPGKIVWAPLKPPVYGAGSTDLPSHHPGVSAIWVGPPVPTPTPAPIGGGGGGAWPPPPSPPPSNFAAAVGNIAPFLNPVTAGSALTSWAVSGWEVQDTLKKGGTCVWASEYGMNVCWDSPYALNRPGGGIVIGHALFMDDSAPADPLKWIADHRLLMEHEQAHIRQQDALGPITFGLIHAANYAGAVGIVGLTGSTKNPSCYLVFEILAGLSKGGYRC